VSHIDQPVAFGSWQHSDAVRTLDDLRRAIGHDPQIAHAAALRLVTLLGPRPPVEVPSVRGGLAPWQQRAVTRYMRQNLERPLRIRDVAAQVSLSASHFCRAFRESFGTPPRQYVTGLRIELAKQLMLSTSDPLTQVALACGMADQAQLSKVFRREVGQTPSSWRRANQQGEKAMIRRIQFAEPA
jgi:AraC family transcriptional regulator